MQLIVECLLVAEWLLQLKYFVKQKLPNCKLVSYRPIRKTVNKVATHVVDDVITQLK